MPGQRLRANLDGTLIAIMALFMLAGFTAEAVNWAEHQPIILLDLHEITRLVDCADAKGSRFLEC